ncbi:hypothetical protein VTJ49DRAFT_4609 [Mycothermus thermophilus]|uniref:Uncharacterized protein n=1 Tax=Humicola insolens TaxID=85995 RepID=A0ABR3V4Z5_HUMIN
MSSHTTLAAASDDRKARLAKLKSLKRKQPSEEQEPTFTSATSPAPADDQDATNQKPSDDNNNNNNDDDTETRTSPHTPTQDVARLHLSGRNYDFETKGPKLGFEAPPILEQPTLEEKAAELERKAKEAAATAPADNTLDLKTLRPKKPNWDLKRDLDQKMQVLNVRTENAIARLVRERLAEKKRGAEAARGVGASADGGKDGQKDGGDAEADGMLEGAAMVERMRMREREEEEENRREREAEDAEFGMAGHVLVPARPTSPAISSAISNARVSPRSLPRGLFVQAKANRNVAVGDHRVRVEEVWQNGEGRATVKRASPYWDKHAQGILSGRGSNGRASRMTAPAPKGAGVKGYEGDLRRLDRDRLRSDLSSSEASRSRFRAFSLSASRLASS